MKLTTLFFLVGLLQVSASGISQNISYSGTSVSLETVFQQLEAQGQYHFLYYSPDLKGLKPVSISAKDMPVEDFLKILLKGQPLGFKVLRNNIVISQKRIRMNNAPPGLLQWSDASDNYPPVNISGIVIGANQQPLAGATIQLKGQKLSTVTNEAGHFELSFDNSKGAMLIVSSVGYSTREIKVGKDETKLQIKLELNLSKLDEVNIIAYGATTRRVSTGSVSVVKGKELAGIPSASLSNLLQGRVAGMDVTNMSGSPGGGGATISIRGFNSLGVEQERRFSDPLWVVDGVPLNSFTSPVTGTNMLADINPDMIESIQVLKDASAASLYGSRAANGVIIVTTKKGSLGQKVQFSANLSQSYSVLPELPAITIGRAERDYRIAALKNNLIAYLDQSTLRFQYPQSILENYLKGGNFDYFFTGQPSTANGNLLQDSLNPFYNNATNFFPAYTQTGKITNANLQSFGGGQNMNYGIGLGYYNETGVIKGTGFNRIDLNSTLNAVPVPKLNIDLRFNVSAISRKRGAKTEQLGSAPVIETVPGDPYTLSSLLPGEGSAAWNTIINKLSETKENNQSVRLRTNFNLSYQLTRDVNISSSLAGDYAVHRRNFFQPSFLSQAGYSNSVGETATNLMLLNENLLTYKKNINAHAINAILGASYQYDRQEYNGGSGANGPSDRIYYVGTGFPTIGQQSYGGYTTPIAFQRYRSDMVEKGLLSYFGRMEYDYKKKYLASISYRRDGSSVFGANNKWGAFPSVAVGWSFSEEGFVKDKLSSWLNLGKIRASWGKSGMQFSKNYLALGIMTVGTPFQGNPVLMPQYSDGLYNDKLSWEETTQYDLGIDLDMFGGRLSITSDYYYRYTDKMLMAIALPASFNGYVSQWRNAAAVSNEGIELLLKYEVLKNANSYWRISVNGARNWNRFEKSYDGKDINSRWVIGKPLAGIYALKTQGYIQSQEEVPVYFNAGNVAGYLATPLLVNYYKPGDYRFYDANGDGVINTKDDQVYIASALPVVSGGIFNEFKWKNIDVNILFSYQLGRHIINIMPVNALSTSVNDWSKPLLLDLYNTSFWRSKGMSDLDYPQVQYNNGNFNYHTSLDRYIEKVNWVKLKTFSVGYELPAAWNKRIAASGIRLFVSGENLFVVSNYSGLDPETVAIDSGYDTGTAYPLSRKITLGLTIKF